MILITGATGTNGIEIVKLQACQSRVTATIAQVAKEKPATFDEFAREHASYFRGEETAVPTVMPSAR